MTGALAHRSGSGEQGVTETGKYFASLLRVDPDSLALSIDAFAKYLPNDSIRRNGTLRRTVGRLRAEQRGQQANYECSTEDPRTYVGHRLTASSVLEPAGPVSRGSPGFPVLFDH